MNRPNHTLYLDSPIGTLKLESTENALTAVRFINGSEKQHSDNSATIPVLTKTRNQLKSYFSGELKSFDLNIEPKGAEFETKVWNELLNIPFGTTITYGGLAEKLGGTNKVRAVGRANGQNPIAIIIPCHRVIGANNKLTGYAGGVERKKWLLRHEGAILL